MPVSMAVFERSQNVVWSLVFLLAVLFALGGCGGGSSDRERTPDPTPVPPERGLTGEFITGQSETLASQDVGPQGGTLVVSRPGHPLDGLEVEIPEGAFDDSQQVTIASAEIFDHTFGEFVEPLTPLLEITIGDDYANDIITVTIPIRSPHNEVGLPIHYDQSVGIIELVPFIDVGPDSVTMATRSFSLFAVAHFRVASLFVPPPEEWPFDEDRRIILDSGFRPGVDDWQFANHGSHITPLGYGTGQVITALAHYMSNPVRLWGLYDNNGHEPATPNFDWDDSLAIRLASVVQHDYLTSLDLQRHRLIRQLMERGSGSETDDQDRYHKMAIRLALSPSETARNADLEPPVLVGVYGESGGHVLIVYKMSEMLVPLGPRRFVDFHVADPNYPGDRNRWIRYDPKTQAFLPYRSGENEYDVVVFQGRWQWYNKRAVFARLAEFELGLVGDDLFPSYGLALIDEENNLMEDDAGNPLLLKDGYVSRDRTLRVLGIGRWNDDDVGALNLVAFRDLNPGSAAQGDVLSIELTEGKNEIGFLVADSFNEYIDFEYIDVWHEQDTFEDPGRIEGRYDVVGADGGIVRDVVTGLEWQRCVVGQTWNPSTGRCDGVWGSLLAWDDAVKETAPGGFRLPTDDELRTLVYCSSGSPALFNETGSRCSGAYTWPTIVVEAFPDTPAQGFWSGSPSAVDPERAKIVSFFYGDDRWEFRHIRARVRLVRLAP